jgi:hypothetical protein
MIYLLLDPQWYLGKFICLNFNPLYLRIYLSLSYLISQVDRLCPIFYFIVLSHY